MCHSAESRPPAPPIRGEVAEHGPVELTASDGRVFAAYRALPAAPNGTRVVLLPDVRGAHPYYAALARCFAEAGFATTVVDYYGRTSGIGARDDDFDWQPHLPRVESAQLEQDVSAALADLPGDGPAYTVGFCFGGGQSWRLAASGLDLAGVVGFYGQPKAVADVVDRLRTPMLLLLAGDDVATPRAEFDALTARLAAAGVAYEAHTYAGAPHSFFDRSYGDWADACDDAWRRVLAFMGNGHA